MDWKTVWTSFGLLFLAELGDKTQLAVLTLSAKSKAPGSVLVGAVVALAIVSAIGAFAGGAVTRFVPPHVLHKLAAVAFIAIGVWMLFSEDKAP